MFDSKVKEKKRKKINSLVQQRLKETDNKDEKLVRQQIMKELRKKSKEKKNEELEVVKKQVRDQLAGEDAKVIEKAVIKAVSQFHSKKKKAKNPKMMLKKKATALIITENTKLWCPKDQAWWDSECQDKFDDLQFLAGCWNINLEKAPRNFGEIYPEMCKEYFDVLAKKRFNSDEKSVGDSRRKSKSVLEKKYEEKKAKAEAENKTKSDEGIIKEVLDEMLEKNKNLKLKEIKKSWKPTHKPYFDKECSEQYEKLTELAVKQGLDLDANAGDFKKFRKRNKEVCSSYFKLLDDKRTGLDDKQKRKKERKQAAQQETAKSSSLSTNGVNKKIKFDEDDETTVGVKKEKENKEPFDVDKTINKIDKKLKKKNLKRKIKDES